MSVLADNLKVLGDGIGTEQSTTQSSTGMAQAPGTVLTSSLLDALKRRQCDTSQQQAGTLSVGQVVALPEGRRPDSVHRSLLTVPGEAGS
ncbi:MULTISPECIES: hypothetical protein [Streptomyces]|uniref:hypothetical protein n=1 Tax=Streptomyces TaxID=1883 RepID=UPI0023DD1C68|nr:hypothetical protein [Streptomyces sp. FXJ1.172]WEP00555.1 hypothetical protein A6P39_043225 [Streptomyces sp. FXJ1.172]